MAPVYPDGVYNHSDVWGSATNDRVMYERTFAQGGDEQQKVAQAMLSASIAYPIDAIRAMADALPMPAPSLPVKTSMTLDEVLAVGPKPDVMLNSRAGSDFSGTNGGYEGTARPGI